MSNFFRGKQSRALLDGSYTVSLLKNSEPKIIQLGSKQVTEIQTRWDKSLTLKQIKSYFRDYRLQPQKCRPDVSIQQALHTFLFAGSILDAPVQSMLAKDTELLICSDAEPVLTNIPWELTYASPTITRSEANGGVLAECFEAALASVPLGRVLLGSRSDDLDKTPERLRILYCISEPPANTQFGAMRFLEIIDRILLERSGMLDTAKITGPNLSPRFDAVTAKLAEVSPHIVVIVCHGQTQNGQASLLFDGWIPAQTVAATIAKTKKTFLVVLIACDQVITEETPAAESGALAMIKAGIPAALAMQSSIRADLAAEFLGGMLDNLFHTNIAAAAARGRQKMAPNQAACSNVEWSFPAIFLSSDALAQTADLTHRLKGYIPSLEAMLRSLPAMAVAGYFPRPIAEKSIQQWLTSSEPGLRAVEGPKFVGKTTTVREACRAAIKNAILTENMAMRPILYVDMDGRLVPDDADALFAILRSRMAEATPAMGPMLYPMIPLARGADGANVNFGLAQLLGLIDSNLILILDNFNPTTKLWEEFLKQAKALVRSTVIAVVTDASSLQLPAVSKMSVSPLNMDETRQFLEFMRSDLENRAQQIFQETGGLPLLLNFVATQDGTGSGPLSNDFPEEQIKKLIDQLDGNDGSVLFQMAVLENGLSFDLASRFLSNWNEAKISSLVARGLLTTEYRQETRWFRLTEFVREGLLTLPVKARDEIREILAGNFREQISEGDAAEDNIRRLIASPGGRDFIQDMHVLFAAMGATEDLRAVPSLVNEWLFGHGHWEDAYRLWRRVVKTLPFDETLADDWIMLANAAHKLGRPQQACKALRDAKRRSPDAIEMLRMKLLYALIIKDLGAKKHSKKVTSIYDWALSFIDAVLKKPDADMHWLSWQKAITMYNRALHRRYWLRDIPGALSDLESAARQFKALADAQMMAMADCEWAEIQLTVKEGERDWPAIFSKLVNADQALEKEAVPSDRAFCNYQLARYYRRRPTTDQDDKKRQIENAREAYGKAMEQAAIARDLRQQEIAEAGLVEISYFILHDMTDEEASRRLEKVARALENFRGDAWSTRVLRDVLLWRGQLQNGSLEFLNKALQIATSPPLTPQNGTDACRAAWILGQYLTVLAGHGQQGEQERVSVKHAPLLKTWLGNSIDPSRPDQWINQLRGFGHAPGE